MNAGKEPHSIAEGASDEAFDILKTTPAEKNTLKLRDFTFTDFCTHFGFRLSPLDLNK